MKMKCLAYGIICLMSMTEFYAASIEDLPITCFIEGIFSFTEAGTPKYIKVIGLSSVSLYSNVQFDDNNGNFSSPDGKFVISPKTTGMPILNCETNTVNLIASEFDTSTEPPTLIRSNTSTASGSFSAAVFGLDSSTATPVCGTYTAGQTPCLPPSSSESSSGLSIGAIVGIAVGCAVGISALSTGLWFLLRR